MKSLYSICLEIISDHADCISDWIDIPLDPFILDILQTIHRKESRIKPSIYERIGVAHGSHLPNHLGTVSLVGRDTTALRTATQLIPRFITHLNMSNMDGIDDQTIILVKPCIHLKVLDVSHVNITDLGVSHLVRMATTPGLLNQLQVLGLSANKLSDKCLKYLIKVPTLTGVDLSYTNVTQIAIRFMKQHQFKALYAHSSSSFDILQSLHPGFPYESNMNLVKGGELEHEDIGNYSLVTWHDIYGTNQRRSGVKYLDSKKQQKNPGYNIKLNSSLFKIVGQPLIPIRHRSRPMYGHFFSDLCFVRSTITMDEEKKSDTSISGSRKKRARIDNDSSLSTSPSTTQKQNLPNVMDYLKMIEKDLGI
ncbi:hypothetical protein INT45_010534 [Circinella minor]|uniref:Uncharacterized protein n=1 Tax=Circinella minor TaxID=1195481 RepID=A0A8H7VPY5_9FUNG|nr:hypothetical protein INT45_010534 [Circinella minor]